MLAHGEFTYRFNSSFRSLFVTNLVSRQQFDVSRRANDSWLKCHTVTSPPPPLRCCCRCQAEESRCLRKHSLTLAFQSHNESRSCPWTNESEALVFNATEWMKKWGSDSSGPGCRSPPGGWTMIALLSVGANYTRDVTTHSLQPELRNNVYICEIMCYH